jgi:hypothetical protein
VRCLGVLVMPLCLRVVYVYYILCKVRCLGVLVIPLCLRVVYIYYILCKARCLGVLFTEHTINLEHHQTKGNH